MGLFQISEFGLIIRESDFRSRHQWGASFSIVPDEVFAELLGFVLETQREIAEEHQPLDINFRAGKAILRAKNHVGLIQTPSGAVLEILPKLVKAGDGDSVERARRAFLKMVRCLPDAPFSETTSARLGIESGFPILEVFIHSFVSECQLLLARGMQFDYALQEDQLPFIRGKVNYRNHLRTSISDKCTFNCEFFEFLPDIAPNRIIKAALLRLARESLSREAIARIRRILFYFDRVSNVSNFHADIKEVGKLTRLFARYETLINWSLIFLGESSFTMVPGSNENLSILFPIDRLFENYVGRAFMRCAPKFTVSLQHQKLKLVNNHKGRGMFSIRPDIVLFQEACPRILIDTKWKYVGGGVPGQSYGISQADAYQLFAYGKKYSSLGNTPKLALIYPAHSKFDTPLEKFEFEQGLELFVVPFDIEADEMAQVSQIINLCDPNGERDNLQL